MMDIDWAPREREKSILGTMTQIREENEIQHSYLFEH